MLCFVRDDDAQAGDVGAREIEEDMFSCTYFMNFLLLISNFYI